MRIMLNIEVEIDDPVEENSGTFVEDVLKLLRDELKDRTLRIVHVNFNGDHRTAAEGS